MNKHRSLLERASDLAAVANPTTSAVLHEMALSIQDLRYSLRMANDRSDQRGSNIIELQFTLGRTESALRKCLSVLEDVRGNINPERGFVGELETDVLNAINAAKGLV